MLYLLFKSLHIITMVAWFAGLFYLVRLFVYHVEAFDQEEDKRIILTKQFNIMERRLYRFICNPAMMLTWTFGLIMLYMNGLEWLKLNPWMHIKITLVILLTLYHLRCKKYIEKLDQGIKPFNSFQYRLFNELPTLFLVTIVILAVFKNSTNYVYTFGGIIAFAIVLFLIVRLYKSKREK
ncbi:MAG: protoporphyrinogen oxidase HemJ [Saprospiraceae bacterium]|nr:protoporphyrinogen oxidase HemJ [Saprospiraceae bacterium]